jgi:hypothetical protein
MLDTAALIEKHRSKGVLVDTNLLVLFLVGSVNKRRIGEFKRTQNFTVEDFDLLSQLIPWFGTLVTTPHVLSQVSDLTDLPGKDLHAVRRLFNILVEQMEESYHLSRVFVTHDLFSRLGVTDAAIATVCSTGILVLTTDLNLQLALLHGGADALNFNHIRPIGMGLIKM